MTFSDYIYEVETISPKILEKFRFFRKIATLRHTKNIFFDQQILDFSKFSSFQWYFFLINNPIGLLMIFSSSRELIASLQLKIWLILLKIWKMQPKLGPGLLFFNQQHCFFEIFTSKIMKFNQILLFTYFLLVSKVNNEKSSQYRCEILLQQDPMQATMHKYD